MNAAKSWFLKFVGAIISRNGRASVGGKSEEAFVGSTFAFWMCHAKPVCVWLGMPQGCDGAGM